ncbi:MAG: oxygen-dependent coproporphyrinogen oxidase [Planctomycetota bacterium]
MIDRLHEATQELPFRKRMLELMLGAQDSICAGLQAVEDERQSGRRFQTDFWEHPEAGGGRTRVLSGGACFEKGGVNVSAVRGSFPPDFAAKLPGSGTEFFATGVSLVLHPLNPHVPTVHANFRYIEQGDARWFGGGADLTPYYFQAEDKEHFHSVWRELCERHADVADHARFRDWCDRYFYLPHRGERRGVGGIFFDYLQVSDAEPDKLEHTAAFVQEGTGSFLDAYLPIVKRRLDTAYTAEQKQWQEYRRGRYVEFNLLYDRGTLFGLKTGGRVESILMSLPPTVRWRYASGDSEPPPGSAEHELLEQLRRPPPPEDTV